MKKETQCVHNGTIKDAVTGGVNSPIFSSSAFSYLDREQIAYPCYFNTPNRIFYRRPGDGAGGAFENC